MANNILRIVFRKALSFFYTYYFPSLLKNRKGKIVATHISAFNLYNAGDFLLAVVARDLFSKYLGVRKWHHSYVRKLVRHDDVERINNDDFVLIGGGGLFLCDTAPNDISGWQWNCSITELNCIKKPIIAFAIGYNRFRGQSDFKPIFKEHINSFVKQAAFVGLRNHGSIENLNSYIEDNALKGKIVFQPCMTTLISKIYPELENYDEKDSYIVINCAFDRLKFRATSDNYLYSLSRVLKKLSSRIKIKYSIHVRSDIDALKYLNDLNVEYDIVEFYSARQMIRFYAKAQLVIGMRGHSQMIPFGCNTPIISLVSHDKMAWFLEDIHHPEWGIDVMDKDFEEKLFRNASFILDHVGQFVDEEKKQQDILWDITMNNIRNISKSL